LQAFGESSSPKEQKILWLKLWRILLQRATLWALRGELSREIRAMASDRGKSILQSQNPEDLKKFKWDTLLCELLKYAPVLSRLLLLATKTKRLRLQKAVIGVCATILINHRNSVMNLVQKPASLILYAGHTSKQVCTYHIHMYLYSFAWQPKLWVAKPTNFRGGLMLLVGLGNGFEWWWSYTTDIWRYSIIHLVPLSLR